MLFLNILEPTKAYKTAVCKATEVDTMSTLPEYDSAEDPFFFSPSSFSLFPVLTFTLWKHASGPDKASHNFSQSK